MITKRRGVALMLTLMVSFFLVVLLGAFLIVHRGNSSLTQNSLKRQRAYNVCVTALHYAWGELELNQGWGAGGFGNGRRVVKLPPVEPKLIVTIHGDRDNPEDLTKNYLEAELPATGETFSMKMVNNLQKRTVMEDTDIGSVPGRSVKLKIVGRSGGAELTLTSVLRKKPFVDYSALSNQDLSIQLSGVVGDERNWKIRSKDPYVNQIRSNTQILAPSAIDNDVLFSAPPRGGVAKATNDIVLDGTSVKSDRDFLIQSERTAKGQFETGTSVIDVPGLKQEDLRFPEKEMRIPGGTLTMAKLEKHEWTSRSFGVDTSSPPDGIPDTNVVRWRRVKTQYPSLQHNSRVWVGTQGVPVEDSGPLNGPNDGFPSPTSSPGFQDVLTQPTEFNDYPVLYDNGDGAKIRANLTTGEIALSPGAKFKVDGQLQILKTEGAPQPNLLFGYTIDDEGQAEFLGGNSGNSAIENPEQNSAALVTSESFYIDGIATGFGSIFADREVSLRAKSGLRAEPDMAVAIHGRRISFQAEDPPDGQTQNRLLDADWDMFKAALSRGGGYGSFEDWQELDSRAKRSLLGDDPDRDTGVRTRSTDKTAAEAWDALSNELALGPRPNFGSPPFGSEWSGKLTLEQYVQLREFARSGESRWLGDSDSRFNSTLGLMDSQIGTYVRWSAIMGLPLADFMAADRPEIADVYFVGLVHAGEGGLQADTNDSSLLIEGSVVSQGGIKIENAPAVDFVYNRLYLDDVLREFRSDHVELDQVYFKIN